MSLQTDYSRDQQKQRAGDRVSPKTRWNELAELPFPHDFPSEESRIQLLDELYFQRAVQVYLAALPAVSMLAMRAGSEAEFGGGYNVLGRIHRIRTIRGHR